MAYGEKDAFFETMEAQHLALTYDDVRLQTRHGHLQPPQAPDITSQFSRNVGLKSPFASAAMDTVTEADMAIAMAKLGGIGVIHAAMEPEEQLRQVRSVKLELNGLIEKPITVKDSDSLQSILNQHGHRNFRTFPVIAENGVCVGVMTGNDFDFCQDESERASDHMTQLGALLTAPKGTTIQEAHAIMLAEKKKTLPIIDEHGRVASMYLWSDVNRIMRDNSGMYNVDKNGRLVVAAAISTDKAGLERAKAMGRYVDVFVLDSADGDSYYAFQALEDVKSEISGTDVVVGNISDGESAAEFGRAGADGVKVGQGPGSICSTRREIGIGKPQVTAVYDCSRALRDTDVPVNADGGIRYHGDIPIAIAAGASSVMMGSMLAGTDEAPGDIVIQSDGSRGKKYRGMGSASALRESAASRSRYGNGGDMPLPEGVESTVALKGSAADVIGDCVKALTKAMRYVKVSSVPQMQQEARFMRITGSGLIESHPHSVNQAR